MSNKSDEEKVIKRMRGETQRLATAIEKAESSDVRKKSLKEQAVERYQKLCDESSSKFNGFLKLMGQKSAETLKIMAEMDSYLTNKVGSIINLLRESPNIASESKEIFENLRLLCALDNKYKEAIFTELNKPENKEKAGAILSHLLSHGVVTREEVQENFSISVPTVKMAILVDTLMKSKKTGSTTISEQVAEIKKIAEADPSARATLLSSMMSLGYATDRNIHDKDGKLRSLILSEDREGALKWDFAELDTVLSHMSKHVEKDNTSNNLYNWYLVEQVQNLHTKSMQEMGLGGADYAVKSSVDTIDKAGEGKKTPDDIAKKYVSGLVGVGIKANVNTSRWAALTGNMFEDETAPKFGEFMLRCAEEMNIVRLNSDRKITDVNWSRALNPFALLEYGMLGLEVGVKRVGALFGEHTTARTVFQAPFVALLRIPRLVFELLGRAISIPDVPDRYGDAEKNEKTALATYKGKMQNFNFGKHAETPWALANFMYNHRKEGAYANVKTDYDKQISQLLVARKNRSESSRLAAIEVMALRNTLVEFESKTLKTSADKLVIESVKAKLEKALTALKDEVSKEAGKEEAKDNAILEGGQTMTDTTRLDSRSEATEESVMRLNLDEVKAGHGVGGSDTDSEASDSSPRTERDSLLSEKVEAPGLFGRFREALAAVGRLFGGGKAEAKAGAAVESGEAKYEYNQVKLNGAANGFRSLEDEFAVWSKTQGGHKSTQGAKEGEMTYEFSGGRTIEVSGKDVVMKGFSAAACKSFKKEMDEMFLNKPTVNISALSGKSINEIAQSFGGNNTSTFMSRLTSIGLFFQQLGSTIKSLFIGPLTPAPQAQATKAEPAVIKAEESKMSVDTIEVAHVPKPMPTPAPKSSEEVDQKRHSHPPIPVSVETKNDRRQIKSAPAKGIPTWASRVSVTIASNRDLQATQSTVTDYANTHGFRDVQVEQKSHSLSMQLEDKNGGRLSVSAEEGKHTVNIEEVRRSDDTPKHIAQIATELPNKGPKEVTVSGRDSMKDKVETALKTVGEHKITTAADKENLSHHANQATTPHK